MNNNHVYDMIVVGEGLHIIQTFEPILSVLPYGQ